MTIIKEKLIGRKVVGIDMSSDNEELRFRFSEGEPVVWRVEGDCCSHSYWHEAFALNQLRNGVVRDVITIDLDDPEDQSNGDCIQAYGYSIQTDRGAGTLVFRNSSNGYYGGYAYDSNDHEGYRWREITAGDWEAGAESDPPVFTPEELAAQAEEVRKAEAVQHFARGLQECSDQLSTVGGLGGLARLSYTDKARLATLVQDLQDIPTGTLLVLGVYLTAMAEETMRDRAAVTA